LCGFSAVIRDDFFLPLLSRILEQDFRFDSRRMITVLLFLDNSGGSWK